MYRAIIALTILFASLSNVFTVKASPIDPQYGVLIHMFTDREIGEYGAHIAVLSIWHGGEATNRTYHTIAIDRTSDTMPIPAIVNGKMHVDVYTQTAELINFMQSDYMYTARIVDFQYTVELTGKQFVTDSNNAHSNVFTMYLHDTNETLIAQFDSTDNPNIDNGIATVEFKLDGRWNGIAYQTIDGTLRGFSFNELDIDPRPAHKIFIPIISK